MFKSILVLLDSQSSKSDIAQYAVDFAGISRSHITLAYMLDAAEGYGGNPCTDPVAWSLRKSEANNTLAQLVQQLSLDTINVTTTVLDNQPIEMLSQQTDLAGVDLIIMAKPSGNMGDKTLVKTTAIPILYVPTTRTSKSQYQSILVPLDGSQRAECPLPLIQLLYQAFTTKIVLVHVMQPPSGIYAQGMRSSEQDLITQLTESGKVRATQYLQDFASRLDAPTDVKVVVSSNVSSSIHQIIDDEGIDIVVLSAHGESGEPNLPLGSIAQKLIASASIPVLVVQDLPEKLNENHYQVTQRPTPNRKAL